MRYEEIVIWRIHMKILPHQRQVITHWLAIQNVTFRKFKADYKYFLLRLLKSCHICRCTYVLLIRSVSSIKSKKVSNNSLSICLWFAQQPQHSGV